MIKNIYEVLDDVAKAAPEDKQQTLALADSYALRQIMRAAFDDRIEFVFEEPVQYRPSQAPAGLSDTTLHKEVNRLYLFEKNNPHVSPNLTFERKKQILIQLLESLEAREAEVLMASLTKNLKVDGLNKRLVELTFPGLLD